MENCYKLDHISRYYFKQKLDVFFIIYLDDIWIFINDLG